MLGCLFICWNILKMRITSYIIVYVSLILWLRNINEEIEYCVIRLRIWKRKFILTRTWKMKISFCLKVESACLMLAYLCTLLWRFSIHVYGILIAAILVTWQGINHCLSLSKRRLVTLWHLAMEVMLKFLAKGLLRYRDYLYWKMSYTSKGWRRIS